MTKKAWKAAAARALTGHALKQEALQQRQWQSDLDIMEINSNTVDVCMPDSTVPDAQVMADSHWQPEYIVLDLEDNEEDCEYTGQVDELVGHESKWELDVEEGSDEELRKLIPRVWKR